MGLTMSDIREICGVATPLSLRKVPQRGLGSRDRSYPLPEIDPSRRKVCGRLGSKDKRDPNNHVIFDRIIDDCIVHLLDIADGTPHLEIDSRITIYKDRDGDFREYEE